MLQKQDIYIYSYAWDELVEDETCIRAYGLNEKDENVCIKIKGFTPYCYIELPIVNSITWNESTSQILGNKLDELLPNKIVKKCLMKRRRLYNAHLNDKYQHILFPYLFCCFNSKNDMKSLSIKLRRPIVISGIGTYKYTLQEYDIDPILQLTSCKNIPTAGWCTIAYKNELSSGEEGGEPITLCDHEYTVKYNNIKRIKKDKIPNFKYMAFDIETYSSLYPKFPDPEIPKDKVFNISCVLTRDFTNLTIYILSLFNPQLKYITNNKVEGENIIIKTYKTEAELLIGFVDLIKEENPNVIASYNGFGFDIPFLLKRAEITFIYDIYIKQGFHKYNDGLIRNIEWSSSAYKHQQFRFLESEGRVFIDLLPIIRRDYNLSNYDLGTVSSHFLGTTKEDLKPAGLMKCYKLAEKGGETGIKAISIVSKYCIKDSVLVIKLMNTLSIWSGLTSMADICNIQILSIFTQGQQIRSFSQFYKYCFENDIIIEKGKYQAKDTDRYIGANVLDPIPGLYENVVSFDFSALYPSVMIAYNIDYTTLVLDPKVSDEKCNMMIWEDHIQCEHDPKLIRKQELDVIIKKIKDEITELRKNRDKSPTKLKKNFAVKIKELDLKLKPYREERTAIMKNKPKYTLCEKRNFRFLKESLGVVPSILQDLLKTRKDIKNEIKNYEKKLKSETDLDTCNKLRMFINVLDKRQNACKISANSVYGMLGTRHGYLPFMPGAMCTTYKGRENIKLVYKVLKEDYKAELIYSDTDSAYVRFSHIQGIKELWDYCFYVAAEISKLFPRPITLEFEKKIYNKYLITTKKRYMYISCEEDGIIKKKLDKEGKETSDYEIGKKGVLLARRDNSQFIRYIYEEFVRKVFSGEPFDDILYFIILELNKLCFSYFQPSMFIIIKSVGNTNEMQLTSEYDEEKGKTVYKIGDYKIKKLLPTDKEERIKQLEKLDAEDEQEFYLHQLPAQVQLAEKMKKRGTLVKAGSRLEYIITNQGTHDSKQYVKIENYEYFTEHKDVLKIDYLYYLKLLVKPLDELINIISVKNKNFTQTQYNFRYKIRNKLLQELKNKFKPKITIKK